MPAMSHDEIDRAMQVAMEHHRAGRIPQAAAGYRQVLAMQPDHADALHLLGVIAGQSGRPDDAIKLIRRAIAAAPDNAIYHCDLAGFLHAHGQVDAAVASYQRAIQLKGDFAEVHYNLGVIWKEKLQLDAAIACYERAISLSPNLAKAHDALGTAFKDAGQLDQAMACYRRALQLDPNYLEAWEDLLYVLLFHPASTRRSLLAEHRRWNDRFARPLGRFTRPPNNDRDPDRRLRVGYVSPDLRQHPVGRFMLPLLASHDRDAVEVYCYAQISKPDDLTAKLKGHAAVWRTIEGLSDEAVTELIRQDQIDILVDLAMHTGNNRLLVFARKPAPVQVTYLAVAYGAGVEAIDYRLTDRYLDPDEADDIDYIEKSIRLAGTYWCYRPSVATEPAGGLPVLAAGKVTFGCLNNFAKVSSAAMETWAKILLAVPGARLILHSHAGRHWERITQLFADQGVAADRIEILQMLSMKDYIEQYRRIDIALDPFPYAGATTTCDALWMGVPVVTLAGRTAVGRAGVSILSNVGRTEWIARSREHYMQLAIDLAGDLPRLAQSRLTLRQQMRNSPLMDEKGYARGIEAAYRTMWRYWCAQPSLNTSPQP